MKIMLFILFLATSIWSYMWTFSRYISWKFTGNLFITAIPSLSTDTKFLSINFSLETSKKSLQGERRGETRIRRGVFSTKFFLKTLIQRSSGTEKLFRDGIVSILDFSYCFDVFFFSCFSLPREKRKNESIEANLFERKYRFVKILISNHLFLLVILCLFISIVDEYSSGIDLLHKKMLLNIFDLFLEISES